MESQSSENAVPRYYLALLNRTHSVEILLSVVLSSSARRFAIRLCRRSAWLMITTQTVFATVKCNSTIINHFLKNKTHKKLTAENLSGINAPVTKITVF